MFANLISKDLYLEYVENLQQRENNNKMSKTFEYVIYKEDIWITNEHTNRYSISLTIREMLIKTTLTYH